MPASIKSRQATSVCRWYLDFGGRKIGVIDCEYPVILLIEIAQQQGYRFHSRSLALLKFLKQLKITKISLRPYSSTQHPYCSCLNTTCNHECTFNGSSSSRVLANRIQFTPVNPRPLLQSLYVSSLHLPGLSTSSRNVLRIQHDAC